MVDYTNLVYFFVGLALTYTGMSNEIYLNHPTFGLLYRICQLDNDQEIFTTLYAQRLFFVVTATKDSIQFDSVTRADAKLMIENRLRLLRRSGQIDAYQTLLQLYKSKF